MTHAAAMVALLVAWTARLYRLGAQSFWYDEGTSVTVAPRDLGTILANAASDIHPPLYYLLLHYWVGEVGTSEWAVRLLSVGFGVLTTAVLYRLGRDLLGPVGAFAAVTIAALAPLPIWYSQEARMYALATLAGAGATLLLLRAANRGRWELWGCYGALTAVTLYSHYFAATIPVAHGLAVASQWQRRREVMLPWIAATTAAGLLFLPWVIRTLAQLTGWPATAPPYGLRELVARTLGVLALGQGGADSSVQASATLAASLVLGAVWLIRRERGLARWAVIAALVVPLVAMFAVSRARPFFHAKFVLLVAPYADLMLASAVAAIGRRRMLALVTLVALLGWRATGTWAQWHDPRLARDDYRGLAAEIGRQEEPGDAIVLNAPGQVELFGHYYRGAASLYPLPERRPPDRVATEARLGGVAERHPRVWLVAWAARESDPEGIVENWLDQQMYETGGRWWGGVRTALYLNPQLTAVRPVQHGVGATIGDFAELRTVELLPLDVRAGQSVPLTLIWHAMKSANRRYTTFVHLIDEEEYLWGQRDAEPASGSRPTDGWRAGETITDRVGLPILAGTPPGSYRLEIGMYRPDDGGRLSIRDVSGQMLGDRLLVGPIEVGPGREDEEPRPEHVLDVALGGARLLGYDLHPLGRDDAPAELIEGEPLLLTLHWRADRSARTELGPARLYVADRELGIQIGRGQYPPERWAPGEYLRDPHRLSTVGWPRGQHAFLLDVAGQRISIGAVIVR